MKLYKDLNKELGADIYSSNNNIIWVDVVKDHKLSEQFIDRWKNILPWGYISYYQFLSEQFIEKYQDRVNWDCISIYQKLSKEFIEKYKDKINFYELKKNVLTQTDIGKDWFVAYLSKKSYSYKEYGSLCFSQLPGSNTIFYKIQIYYKDMITLNNISKINILRTVSNYKKFNL